MNIHYSTGYSLASNSVKLTIGGYDSWLTSGRGTDWEIVNPSDALYSAPDTDGDGVDDNSDYFPNDANYTQTESELDAYSLDTHKTPASGDIIRILQDSAPYGVSVTSGEYYIITGYASSSGNIRTTLSDGNDYWWGGTTRATGWEIVNPSNNLAPAPKGTAYYVWGNDGTNGDGYYYPVYTTTTGLSSYHTHTIGGVDYYMEDSDQNHGQDNLPQNHSYTLAPNTLEPTYNIGDLVVSTHTDGHGNANVEHDAIVLNVKWANNKWQYDGKFMAVAPWNSCSTYSNFDDTYFSTTYQNGNPPNDHTCFHT